LNWIRIAISFVNRSILGCFLLFVSCPLPLRAQEAGIEELPKLSLVGVNGERIEWAEANQFRVLCFLGVDCPVARFYASRINELAKRFADRIQVVGVNSNLHDSVDDLMRFAKVLELSFPQVKDTDQSIARAFGATRTAEVIVIDRKQQVLYRGRVDDQYAPGIKRTAATRNELEEALTLLLSGKPPAIARTEPVGCLITFEKKVAESASITFCKQVAPILYEHCYECHRPNEIGPFDVSQFEELRGWADMVIEVIEQKRMPPWHATDTDYAFKNARHFPQASLDVLKQWVKDGAPYGVASELPQLPETRSGWRLPKSPDLVVAMREQPYTIAATGAIDYQYFVVDPKITEDRWVSAAQVIPGNSSVVHHAIVFIRPPDGVDSNGVGWLTAFVPGQRATTFPPGYARRVPAGSKLVFQMHYTPNGVEQTDITKIGVNFIEPKHVTHEVFTLVGLDQEFEIPPHAADHLVSTSVSRWPVNSELLAIMPHMHLRGKSFQLTANAKLQPANDTSSSTLLNVPRYDFNWQHTYELESPIPLNSVQKLNIMVSFDNSKNNPFNPNPDEYVLWGDQTWEEMAVAFLEVAKPLNDVQDRSDSVSSNHQNSLAASNAGTLPDDPNAIAFADNLLRKYDRNRDGQLSREEAPQIIRDYSFSKLDANGNGIVTRDEIVAATTRKRRD
jgi:peroxiredoxin